MKTPAELRIAVLLLMAVGFHSQGAVSWPGRAEALDPESGIGVYVQPDEMARDKLKATMIYGFFTTNSRWLTLTLPNC